MSACSLGSFLESACTLLSFLAVANVVEWILEKTGSHFLSGFVGMAIFPIVYAFLYYTFFLGDICAKS
ncbi:MAG: hypothetical protein N2512_01000 [Armatimonadetes bacterium]|nr:hypothetical protein [Armatimonadota bacterium]